MIYNVLQYLENSEAAYPQKAIFMDDADKITYAAFVNAAKRMGTYLLDKTNGRMNQPVVVLIDRNILSVLAFIGIVYSGNFYVPVDASMPLERIQAIYKTLHPVMILDARNNHCKDSGYIDVRAVINDMRIDEEALWKIRKKAIDTDPLYAIFTSGSTGIPKAVLISHKSVIDMVESFEDAFHFDHTCIFGNQSPFDFDVSVKDMYNAMKVGGSVVILPKKLFKLPKLLIEYIKQKGINTLIWAVSALRIPADFKVFDYIEAPDLRYIMFSGEIMPVRVLNYWMNHIKQARYINLYGPTEITCNCTYYEVLYQHKETEILPIGKAFRNSRVFLRDENGKMINDRDLVGEICVAGTCLALGYWNNATRTAQAFSRDSEVFGYDVRVYATGDMGYYNKDDDIVFVSRKDFQIKHMGYRIELGEIEAALNALPFLEISCCAYQKEKEQIVCFYQSKAECKKEIMDGISKMLPKYMWPGVYIYYEELPLNKNGKIDRLMLIKDLEI